MCERRGCGSVRHRPVSSPRFSLFSTLARDALHDEDSGILAHRRPLCRCQYTLLLLARTSWPSAHTRNSCRVPALTRPRKLVSYNACILCAHQLIILTPQLLHTAASEVSSILESRISGSSAGSDVQETGRVLSAPRFDLNTCNSFLTGDQAAVTVLHVSGVSAMSRVSTEHVSSSLVPSPFRLHPVLIMLDAHNSRYVPSLSQQAYACADQERSRGVCGRKSREILTCCAPCRRAEFTRPYARNILDSFGLVLSATHRALHSCMSTRRRCYLHRLCVSLPVMLTFTPHRRDGGVFFRRPRHVLELGSRQRRCVHLR